MFRTLLCPSSGAFHHCTCSLWLPCGVVSVASSSPVLLLLPAGRQAVTTEQGHTCNTMRIYHDTIIKCATLDGFFFVHCVTSRTRYGVCAVSKVIRNNRAVRHIHVKLYSSSSSLNTFYMSSLSEIVTATMKARKINTNRDC
jgi:hypothetical protein